VQLNRKIKNILRKLSTIYPVNIPSATTLEDYVLILWGLLGFFSRVVVIHQKCKRCTTWSSEHNSSWRPL